MSGWTELDLVELAGAVDADPSVVGAMVEELGPSPSQLEARVASFVIARALAQTNGQDDVVAWLMRFLARDLQPDASMAVSLFAATRLAVVFDVPTDVLAVIEELLQPHLEWALSHDEPVREFAELTLLYLDKDDLLPSDTRPTQGVGGHAVDHQSECDD